MTNEPAPPATQDGADPSMEEILASIRRILNDDDMPSDPPETQAADDDVLLLDESMMVAAREPIPAVEAANFVEPEVPMPTVSEPIAESFDHEPVVVPPEADHETEVAAPAMQTEPREQVAPTLVAPETAAAAASSVGNLVRTLAAGRTTQIYGGGPTLEDMVRAELRPLLKEWLDTYLPPMVERLVRTEIERVVGREFP